MASKREVKVSIVGDTSDFEKKIGGLSGKLKGGIGALAGGFGLAAIGKGLFDVSKQFQDTALSAKNFATATGLSVDQASRLREVSGDLGVDAEKTQTAIVKLAKNIGTSSGKLDKLGFSAAKASDGTVDLNQSFLQAIGLLRSIDDPTQKAIAGNALFGKSWADLAPLIDAGGVAVKNLMQQVGDGQAITDQEVTQAKKLRDSFDNFNDSVDKIKMNLASGLAPAMSTIANWLSTLSPKTVALVVGILAAATAVSKLSGVLTILSANPWVLIIAGIAAAVLVLAANWDKVTAAVGNATQAIKNFFSNIPGASFLSKLPGFNSKSFTPVGFVNPPPSHAVGGTVEGPFGMPRLIEAHGGERIQPSGRKPESSGGGVTITGPVYVSGVTDLRSFQVQLQREADRQKRGGKAA